jgi:hypothetical protein
MELNELFGKRLIKINKQYKHVELLFGDDREKLCLKFKGFVFETELSPLNQMALKIERSKSLGMKGIDLLDYLNINDREEIEQVLIKFDEEAFKKNELICIGKNWRLSRAYQSNRFEKQFQIQGLEAMLLNCMISEMPSELDALSTHTSVEDVVEIDITGLSIEGESVYVEGSGQVLVKLQYGSDGDQERGDGHIDNDAYPFIFEVSLMFNESGKLEIESMNALEVDTSLFYSDDSW